MRNYAYNFFHSDLSLDEELYLTAAPGDAKVLAQIKGSQLTRAGLPSKLSATPASGCGNQLKLPRVKSKIAENYDSRGEGSLFLTHHGTT